MKGFLSNRISITVCHMQMENEQEVWRVDSRIWKFKSWSRACMFEGWGIIGVAEDYFNFYLALKVGFIMPVTFLMEEDSLVAQLWCGGGVLNMS